MADKIYDVIIIGSGPAGMTAGIYCGRRALKTLILGDQMDGQMVKSLVVENYPGVESITGINLSSGMKKQAEKFGAEFVNGIVEKITKQDDVFELKLADKTLSAKAVILAFGLKKKKLGLANEEKYEGRGLTYCVTCDGPLLKDKNVAVVGGGNAGAEAVEFMAKICPRIYWIEIMDHLNATQILKDKIEKLDNVETFLSAQVTELIGDDFLTGIRIQSKGHGIPHPDKIGTRDDIRVGGLIIEIGYVAKTDWLGDLVDFDKHGQIEIDKLGHTKTPGIFAAGDVTDSKYKQVVLATSSGAVAALEAYEYVQKSN